MSRISRLAVLVTALASLFAVLSSTAGAVTFTNTGTGGAFHATGGAGTLGITPTAGGGGTPSNLTCFDSTATGSLAAGAFTSVNGTVTFTNCKLVGLEVHVGCTYSLTPLTFSAGVTTGTADTHCTVSLQTSPFWAVQYHWHDARPLHQPERIDARQANSDSVEHADRLQRPPRWHRLHGGRCPVRPKDAHRRPQRADAHPH